MTGEEHYREAERLLVVFYQPSPEMIARAQVHATLALAATALADSAARRAVTVEPELRPAVPR